MQLKEIGCWTIQFKVKSSQWRFRWYRKSKLDQFRPEIEALLKNGSTQKFIAGRYNTTEANLHNWLKKNSLKRKDL